MPIVTKCERIYLAWGPHKGSKERHICFVRFQSAQRIIHLPSISFQNPEPQAQGQSRSQTPRGKRCSHAEDAARHSIFPGGGWTQGWTSFKIRYGLQRQTTEWKEVGWGRAYFGGA